MMTGQPPLLQSVAAGVKRTRPRYAVAADACLTRRSVPPATLVGSVAIGNGPRLRLRT